MTIRYKCLLTDLNHQPSVYKTDALPIEPSRQYLFFFTYLIVSILNKMFLSQVILDNSILLYRFFFVIFCVLISLV